jgi:hypothetical protein
MPGEKLQHVIKEAYASGDLVGAAPVQIQATANISLGGLAMQGRDARFHANHPVEE